MNLSHIVSCSLLSVSQLTYFFHTIRNSFASNSKKCRFSQKEDVALEHTNEQIRRNGAAVTKVSYSR